MFNGDYARQLQFLRAEEVKKKNASKWCPDTNPIKPEQRKWTSAQVIFKEQYDEDKRAEGYIRPPSPLANRRKARSHTPPGQGHSAPPRVRHIYQRQWGSIMPSNHP